MRVSGTAGGEEGSPVGSVLGERAGGSSMMWRGGKHIFVVPMSAELGEMCKQVSFIWTSSPTYILGLAHNGETVTGGECSPQLPGRTGAAYNSEILHRL